MKTEFKKAFQMDGWQDETSSLILLALDFFFLHSVSRERVEKKKGSVLAWFFVVVVFFKEINFL